MEIKPYKSPHQIRFDTDMAIQALCGVGAKPVDHLMQYHLLQWKVAKYDFNSA